MRGTAVNNCWATWSRSSNGASESVNVIGDYREMSAFLKHILFKFKKKDCGSVSVYGFWLRRISNSRYGIVSKIRLKKVKL